MWTGLLIWIAKLLIQYFLKTNLELSRELEASVKRNEDHQRELLAISESGEYYQKLISEKASELVIIRSNLIDLENRILDAHIKVHEKRLELENTVDSMDDDAVLRAEL